jgi:hypothetical protein
MPISNTERVLSTLPFAMGAYGSGANTVTGQMSSGLAVGNNSAVPITLFKVTPDSGFQASFYRNPDTGKYTIAFAGTNDATDAIHPDRVLATANALC